MQKHRILWADDEIDLLKPHILFLEAKGYDITPVNSGADALEQIDHHDFDLVFLDENMPGMSGLETLNYMKSTHPTLPVVMITKNEEETIMEEAIGSKISDYLIKPLNPNQILLSAKKILDNKRLISQHTNMGYQQQFQQLSMALSDVTDHHGWAELYRKLVYWDLEIDNTQDKSMADVLNMQWAEANGRFATFVEENYVRWIEEPDEPRPMLSHRVLTKKVIPEIGERPLFLIVIDNLRYDQWKVIEPDVAELFSISDEDYYFSILPTATAYARNALFAGLLPLEISKRHPEYWVGEDDDEGKNNFEEQLLERHLVKAKFPGKFSYHKVIQAAQGKQVTDLLPNLIKNPFNALVYNFVDMLSHARTDMQMIRQLAPDESAYRSLTKSWFLHSPLYDTLKWLSNKKCTVMITTDHGTIRVKSAIQIIGDRNTNTNLRYKQGRNLAYEPEEVFAVRNPETIGLPKVNVSTSYAFARGTDFFAYPNNFNYYVRHYKDTFQHGGISMEEMIVPFITLSSRA
jgi:CheY-like chemotaxis protein